MHHHQILVNSNYIIVTNGYYNYISEYILYDKHDCVDCVAPASVKLVLDRSNIKCNNNNTLFVSLMNNSSDLKRKEIKVTVH